MSELSSSSSSTRYVRQKQMDFDLDVIRSERRRNSDSIYNLKQYHSLYRHSNNSLNNARVTDSCRRQADKSTGSKMGVCQILPSKFVVDRRYDDPMVVDVPNNVTNRRRTSDTYSPYGTRAFPSLRQRSPSTDPNLSASINSLDFSTRKSELHITSNPAGDFSSGSPTLAQSHKNYSQSTKHIPSHHHRISLNAALCSSKSILYSNSATSKSKYLQTDSTYIPKVK